MALKDQIYDNSNSHSCKDFIVIQVNLSPSIGYKNRESKKKTTDF